MPVIEVQNLYKSFGEKAVFRDFSFSVEAGEMLAITGPSGCGKTTLLNIIGLLEPFDGGRVAIDGYANVKPGSRAAGKLLRETISYLFQNFALVEDRTVAFNLLLALHYAPGSAAHKRARVQEALEAVGLAGYEEQKIFRLSGGEQQRVAIARNMIKPGSIILADEPTGSVDAKNRDVILELLHMLNRQGKTIVIVTHDPCVAGACGREVRLLPA